jgi:hypothetical protein
MASNQCYSDSSSLVSKGRPIPGPFRRHYAVRQDLALYSVAAEALFHADHSRTRPYRFLDRFRIRS